MPSAVYPSLQMFNQYGNDWRARLHVRAGKPDEQIAMLAADILADLIVIGQFGLHRAEVQDVPNRVLVAATVPDARRRHAARRSTRRRCARRAPRSARTPTASAGSATSTRRPDRVEHTVYADDRVDRRQPDVVTSLVRCVARASLVATFRRIIRLYFRDIERVGEPPGPETRGRVFVSNHHNALIDPILVLDRRRVRDLADREVDAVVDPGPTWLLDRAGAVPIVRRKDAPDKDASANDAVFDKIAAHLAGGGNILIFPEGTSHSEPHLAPLRTGAARMLIAAESADARRRRSRPSRSSSTTASSSARAASCCGDRCAGSPTSPARRRGARRAR